MKKKKIYIQIITKLEKGGAQLTAVEQVKNIRNSILLSGKDGLYYKDAKKILKKKLFIIPHLIRKIDPIKDALALFELIFFLLKQQNNKRIIVHTNSSKAGILGRLAAIILNIPCVHTIHGWSFNSYQPKIFQKLIILTERLLALKTNKLIVVTKEDIKKGLRNKIGNKDKFSIVRAVTNLEEFRNADSENIKNELNLKDDFIIGSISNFKKQKAPIDFVKIANIIIKKYSNISFIKAGGGPLFNEAKILAKNYNIEKKLFFLGWRDDIPQIIKCFDIFLLVSLWEGLPQVILQSLASGKPVVASAVDGTCEVVKVYYNGLLFAAGNIKEGAEKLEILINNKIIRNKIINNIKNFDFHKFSIYNMINDLKNIYKQL